LCYKIVFDDIAIELAHLGLEPLERLIQLVLQEIEANLETILSFYLYQINEKIIISNHFDIKVYYEEMRKRFKKESFAN